MTNQHDNQTFINIFNNLAKHRHRYEVFQDFVTMTAISLHNAVNKVQTLEQEYLTIIHKYEEEERQQFPDLLGELVELLEASPHDALGQLYMHLDLGNDNNGQFYTPPHISELLARLISSDKLSKLENDFITLSDPTCGAGGMMLAYAKVLIETGHNPADKMWCQCIDIDRTAAFMCYIQLSLWHIPAEVIVGDTLTWQLREVYYTPAHYMNQWNRRLAIKRMLDLMRTTTEPSNEETAEVEQEETNTQATEAKKAEQAKPKQPLASDGLQFDLDL